MPDIDVTDVLLDSDIAGEAFQYERRSETVSVNGRSVQGLQVFDAVGSVQPPGENDLITTEDYDAASNTIVVITTARLRCVSQDQVAAQFKPDIVLWQGNRYVVTKCEPWTEYGAGFIRAVCKSEDFIDQAPG